MGSLRCYLTTDGKMLPCERVPSNDHYYVIGNILNGGIDFDKVVEKMGEFLSASQEDCKNCWCLRMCKVGCLNGMVIKGQVDPSIKLERCCNLRSQRNAELIGMMEMLEVNPNSLDHFNKMIVM